MRWTGERQRHPRFGIALRRIQLGLDQKDTLGEIGTSQVGISQVGPGKVGPSQVSPSQVSSNEICPSQVSPSQIGTFEFGPDEVGSSVVLLLVLDFGSHERTRAQQQSIDGSSVCCHVQFHKSIGVVVSEAFGLREREAELTVERAGRVQRQRFGEIPEQLMEVPHDREHLEHLLCCSRGPPPVLSPEGDLGDLLSRAKAVVSGATPKALLPEACVNAAAEVRLQMRTSLPGVFIDREVCRG
jgi:hypothetical protein